MLMKFAFAYLTFPSGYSSFPDSFKFYSFMSVKQIPLTIKPG